MMVMMTTVMTMMMAYTHNLLTLNLIELTSSFADNDNVNASPSYISDK